MTSIFRLATTVALSVLATVVAYAGLINQSGPRHFTSPSSGNGALDYYGYTCERYVDDTASGSGNGLAVGTAWTYSQAIASGAGLIVCIEPGTYTGSDTDSRFVGTFNPPAGTSGDPTIFVCKRAAAYNTTSRCEFTNGVTTGDSGSVTVSVSNAHSYWIGPYVNEDVSRSMSDTGPMAVYNCDDCGIEAARVDGITVDRPDNHNAIRVEAATNAFVRNCYLTGIKVVGGSSNSAAVMVYSTRTADFDHNFIEDSNTGMYIKGESAGNGEVGNLRVRWNRISTASPSANVGIFWGGPNSDLSLAPNEIAGNLITDAYNGIFFHVFGSVGDPDGPAEIDVHHNSFAAIDATEGVLVWQDCINTSEACNTITTRDNVMVTGGSGYLINLWWSSANNSTIAARGFAINYNAAYGNTSWGLLTSGYSTRAAWNTASGYDANSVQLTGDPFINAAGGDYRLNNTAGAGASARTGSSTGGYMGYEGSGGTPGLQ